MFGRIAPTYDVLNHLLSANVDRVWRRRAVARLHLSGSERVLDACTGTGDVAFALLGAGAGEVVGCDFAPEMIRRAEAKAKVQTVGRIRFEVADVLNLPFADATFDAATAAFGVRNVHDLGRGLRELCRVLRPGGKLVVLEFSRPQGPLVRAIYDTYSTIVLPVVGNLVSGGAGSAYAYLVQSIRSFPAADALAAHMREAGFSSVAVHPLLLGIATIHVAVR